MRIETIVPRNRYATALLIDMSIGPSGSGPPRLELPLVGRVELDSSSPCPTARAPSRVATREQGSAASAPLHVPRLDPKYVASPTPSSAVNAIA